MTEIELKFQVPAASLAAVRAELAEAGARQQTLRAAYVDTPQRHLAQARAAVRLRWEDDAWVQTAKAMGEGLMTRLEHNAPAGQASPRPALDLARHDGTPVAQALARALGEAHDTLAVVFETDVQRTLVDVPAPAGAWVELALDEGTVRAGAHGLALCELEFELRSGEPAALIALARDWVARHGLWLDTRSKAERGELLSRGPQVASPARAARRADPQQPVRQQVAQTLEPLLANASVLADDGLPPEVLADHLRQWHRGLGDLLHVLGVAELQGADGAPNPAWATELIELLAPMDAGAGPSVAVARRVVRAPRTTRLMLALLGWSQPV